MRIDTREITSLVVDSELLTAELIAMALSITGHLAGAVVDERAAVAALRSRPSIRRVLIGASLLRLSPGIISRLHCWAELEVVVMIADGQAVAADALWGVSGFIRKSGQYNEVAAEYDAHFVPQETRRAVSALG